MTSRRAFAGILAAGAAGLAQNRVRFEQSTEVFVERNRTGQPHKGKVLAAIQPHSDDLPLFAAGTIIKLIREGYTGILIRTTNDEMAGAGKTIGEVILNNEKDNAAIAEKMGLRKIYNLGYRNHMMDQSLHNELRSRLVFIFRAMKVDTVIGYDPWGHYEENPDHYVTAQAVEAACWMAGGSWDLTEHFDVGLKPHSVMEKYYFARGPQLVNRAVDISSTIDQKVETNVANVTQGPAGVNGAALRARLAKQNLRLPLLGNDDATANHEYVKHIVLAHDAEFGKKHGLQYAEGFHYMGPERSLLDDYIKKNAVPISR
ncbi:MAG TPA: PIG-L family deacetylase [Bryobacteraceae bacterium]|nr:PIG-L family deacetylase [Bryobacteraceae bacterium]